MTTSSNSQATVSIPFVFLKTRGRAPQNKKAQLPSSLSSLLKVCNRLFRDYGLVRSLFDENGHQIKYITDVIPGSTLYVSNLEPIDGDVGEEMSPSQRGLFNQSNKSNEIVTAEDSYKMIFGQLPPKSREIEIDESLLASRKSAPKAKRQDTESGGSTPKSNKNNRSPRSDDGKDSLSPGTISDSRRGLNSLNKSPDFDSYQSNKNNQNSDSSRNKKNSLVSSPSDQLKSNRSLNSDKPSQKQTNSNSLRGDQQNNDFSDSLEKNYSSSHNNNNNNNSNDHSNDYIYYNNEIDNNSVSSVFSYDAPYLAKFYASIVGNENAAEDFIRGSNDTPKQILKLLGSSPQIENEQVQRWFKYTRSMLNQIFGANPSETTYRQSEVSSFVRNVILRHRFVSAGGNVDYKLNIGIVGPRKSGKTQLLASFIEEVCLDFASTGNWKKFFLVFFNFRLFFPFYGDMVLLYSAVVETVLQALSWQMPSLSKYMSVIRQLFLTVTTARAPPIVPKASRFYEEFPMIAKNFMKITKTLFKLWNDDEAMAQWMTNVYYFPVFIANAVGFEKVLFFIDNIEFADVDILPSEPFCSTNDETPFNIEFLQYAISGQHYIITGEEQSRILEAMTPISTQFSDIEYRTDFISTIGIVDGITDDRVIYLDIQDEGLPFALSFDMCCGVAAYLALWNELNIAFDDFESAVENEAEETKLLLVTQAQNVIDVMFLLPEAAGALFVIDARRVIKEKKKEDEEVPKNEEQ